MTVVSVLMMLGAAVVASNPVCLDEQGSPVDWFIVNKLPGTYKAGLSYYYMDANIMAWTLSAHDLSSPLSSVARTLQPVYNRTQDILYVMYNDEHPDGPTHESFGHTKGVLGGGRASGFWLVHSVPKFPPPQAYAYPASGTEYAQTLLCISLPAKYFNTIGMLYRYNHPSFYAVSIPDSYAGQVPDLVKATRNEHVTEPPFYMTTTLVSLGGQAFTAFAKYTSFHKDLYEDLVAGVMKTALYVETWQNGAAIDLKSNCTGQYKVYNVRGVATPVLKYSETHDHSKWAVSCSAARPLTCVGDINRQVPQLKRGGGTVCFTDPDVHQSFLHLVDKYEHCSAH